MSHTTPAVGLRERKRAATHQRIADEAARLASDRGVSGTTVEEIAAAADIGRSTFFRYFDSKEIAVAEGFTTPWLTLLVRALADQPAELGPMEAVLSAFSGFAGVVEDDPRSIIRQTAMSQASPGLQAWTLHLFARCEQAIAATLAPRFTDLVPGDPRPRMTGALVMAAIRLSMDEWLASGGEGDLPKIIRDALTCVTTQSAPSSHAKDLPL
ncbi:MAG TPA: TetR family transcriptional regulator [Mycobacteriales bacterium]|nr:TetR family transcriptional regulator [Mycobacteriales bacterium]